MTDGPQVVSDTTSMPPLPAQLKAVGYGNLIVGPLLAIVNLLVVGQSISRLERMNAPPAVSTGLEINIGIFFVLAVLFVIGGIGLLLNRKWGRIWSFIAGVFCFVTLLAVSIIPRVVDSLLRTGAIPMRPDQSFAFKGVAGVIAFAPLYGILVIVLLALPDARAWARGRTLYDLGIPDQIPGGGPAPAARPTSGLAIASLVCSFIPFALLTQIAGLTLGIVALIKIKKSQGRLGGKGFAIAGVAVSSAILLFIGGILLMLFVNGRVHLGPATKPTSLMQAEIYPDDPVHQGDQTVMSGTVKNVSQEKLTGLTVVIELTPRGASDFDSQTSLVQPSDLAPQQEGHYRLLYRTKDYSDAKLLMLNGGPGSVTLRFTIVPRSTTGK